MHTVDVRDRASVDEAFDAAAHRLGKLHLLVANAGVGGPDVAMGGDDRFDDIVRTNLDGAYFCVRAFERHLAPGPEPRHIVVISSCVARFGVPGIAAYSAAKAGQLGLVRSLRRRARAARRARERDLPGLGRDADGGGPHARDRRGVGHELRGGAPRAAGRRSAPAHQRARRDRGARRVPRLAGRRGLHRTGLRSRTTARGWASAGPRQRARLRRGTRLGPAAWPGSACGSGRCAEGTKGSARRTD